MSMIWAFNGIENMHGVNRVEDLPKMFCKSLREETLDIINFEKKNMILSPNKEYI